VGHSKNMGFPVVSVIVYEFHDWLCIQILHYVQIIFIIRTSIACDGRYTRVYPEVSGLATWSENCKWYSSVSLGAVVSLFYE